MRLHSYVFTVLVVHVTGTVGSLATDGDLIDGNARPLSVDSSLTNETPFVVSSLPKQQDYGEINTYGGGDQMNEERMYSVSNAEEALSKVVESMEDVVAKTTLVGKDVAERIKAMKSVEEKKIMDQEKVLPLQTDEINTRKRPRDDDKFSEAESSHKLNRRSMDPVMQAKTEDITNIVIKRMAKEKLVMERNIVDQEKFVRLLHDEFGTQIHPLDYDYVVMSLRRTDPLDVNSAIRVTPEELMMAFHSLRSRYGMKEHADGMQRALLEELGNKLKKKLLSLWLDSKVTPEEALKMWESYQLEDFDIVTWYDKKIGQLVYDRDVVPMIKYINDYRRKVSDYTDEAAKELLQGYIDLAHDYRLPKHIKPNEWLERG